MILEIAAFGVLGAWLLFVSWVMVRHGDEPAFAQTGFPWTPVLALTGIATICVFGILFSIGAAAGR